MKHERSQSTKPINQEKKNTRKKVLFILLGIVFVVVVLLVSKSMLVEDKYLITPSTNTVASAEALIEAGVHPLSLGGWQWVNRSFWWRDGVLVIPNTIALDQQKPLLVWLHYGGGNARQFEHLHPLAEKFGIAILLLDARHNTWDGIDSTFGPDVEFMTRALNFVFSRVAIDYDKLALGGISDGAAYALAIGRVNGDLFKHIMAVAPGFLKPPGPRVGTPKIYVAHGNQDNVYPVGFSENVIVPFLRQQGYEVSFKKFEGPHRIPIEVADEMFRWFAASTSLH